MSNFTKLLLKFAGGCIAICLIIAVFAYWLKIRNDFLCNDFEKYGIDIGFSYSCKAIWLYEGVKINKIGPIVGDCGFDGNKSSRESCEQEILRKQEDLIFFRTENIWKQK